MGKGGGGGGGVYMKKQNYFERGGKLSVVMGVSFVMKERERENMNGIRTHNFKHIWLNKYRKGGT